MLQRLPGLIDPHVHLREPGATHKEDFASGTRAALAGGFTYVLDMPNNPVPTVSLAALEEKIRLADAAAVCGIGFHYGTQGKNLPSFTEAAAHPRVFGLKIYCNHTTGDLLLQDPDTLRKIFAAWESDKPILVHAEGRELELALELAAAAGRRLHVCHITQAIEVDWLRIAKQRGQAVTAGVCPHHLWLTGDDRQRLGGSAVMKPPLGTAADRDALRAGLADGTIDLIETDHAPHTREEKAADVPAFGVPGLEWALGLAVAAIRDGWLPADQLQRVLHDRAAAIFNTPAQPDTYVEFDPDESYTVAPPYATKCGWSTYEGWELAGRIHRVVLRGEEVVRDGQLLV